MGMKHDMTGMVFGKLTVLGFAGNDARRNSLWSCQCKCGRNKIAKRQNLMMGCTKSCGCWSKTLPPSVISRNPVEYGIWASMKTRCNNPNTKSYPNYGGRGIRVCSRWVDSFADFLLDMGCRPSMQHTLDRINTNGDYEPSNCQWATAKQQARSRRNLCYITYNGETRSMTEWAELYGITRNALKYRLRVRKTPIGKALTTPLQSRSCVRVF